MPFSAGKSIGGGECINHYGGFRIRVKGSGSLQAQMLGLDSTPSQNLVSLTMSSAPGREPFRLANVVSQRARLIVKTTNIDEVFHINRIIIYAKPLWTDFPG